MKLVVWMVFGLIALVWTGGAFLASELTQWTVQVLASGETASLGKEIARWPVLQWVSLWIDPALIQAMQSSVVWAIEALRDSLPLLSSAVGWLVALVWGLWGLGLLAMFVLACGAHVLLGRVWPDRPRSA
jgi:hypothetical protein